MRASSKGLSTSFPFWKGCTLEEMFMVGIVTIVGMFGILVLIGIMLYFFTPWSVSLYFRIFTFVTFAAWYCLFRWYFCPWFAEKKKGKPSSFWKLELADKISFFGAQIKRKGIWNTRVGDKDV